MDVCELLLHCCFEDVSYGARSFTIYVWHYGYGSKNKAKFFFPWLILWVVLVIEINHR
jgi:hypothetical protein